MQAKFNISGMSCAACSSNIERTVSKLAGVSKVEVNLLMNSMVVQYNPALVSISDMITAVEKIGYGVQLTGGSEGVKLPVKEKSAATARLIVSFALLAPLLYISMGSMLGLPQPEILLGTQNALSFALTQLLLTLPIIFVNRVYFTGGFKALLHRRPNMYSLIALGATVSLAYGIFAMYRISWGLGNGDIAVVHKYMHELYFESAATILALIALGKTLEDKSKGRTGKAIAALLNLAPKTALRIVNGVETEVQLSDVQIGDILAVKPGAAVPTDGIVLSGSGAVDESMVTGESLPVEKTDGDELTGATINTSGYFTMKVTRVGENTTLAQIVKLVEEAGASKAPIAKLADKVAGVFVPIVIGIAVVCFLIWIGIGSGIEFALARAVAVLVISCPCALGLATPVAIMVGSGRGAKSGILFKNAAALENLSRVDTFVLDKTGTITEGKPVITDIVPYNGYTKKALVQAALTLEAKSEHPVAKAITDAAVREGMRAEQAQDFKSIGGLGVSASINGNIYLAGNVRFMDENSVDISMAQNDAADFAQNGKTPLYFAVDGKLCGVIALADMPKQSSHTAIAALKKQGIAVIMLTGDNAATAEAISKMIGVEKVIAQVLPEDKAKVVKQLMDEGHYVAMIGDGINDAPALAVADVGIAIGAGTDVAIEAADIVLMHSTLDDAVIAYRLSRATMRNIKQNLFWAFIYNIICIPIAAGVFYTPFGLLLNPMFAAAAMSLSSIFVVINALRLNMFKDKAPTRELTNISSSMHMITSTGKNEQATQQNFAAPQIRNELTSNHKEIDKMVKHILIDGMSCEHCTMRVQNALNALNGVSADVGLEDKTATVTLTESVGDDVLRKTIEDAGYVVISIKVCS